MILPVGRHDVLDIELEDPVIWVDVVLRGLSDQAARRLVESLREELGTRNWELGGRA